jgi:hypothetical protein
MLWVDVRKNVLEGDKLLVLVTDILRVNGTNVLEGDKLLVLVTEMLWVDVRKNVLE